MKQLTKHHVFLKKIATRMKANQNTTAISAGIQK
jgi:hypothetical protein